MLACKLAPVHIQTTTCMRFSVLFRFNRAAATKQQTRAIADRKLKQVSRESSIMAEPKFKTGLQLWFCHGTTRAEGLVLP